MRGHGAAVVVDVVAWPLADLDAAGDLDGIGVDEGRAVGQRDAADPRGCGGEGAQLGKYCASCRAVT